jgi:hypothetical protein
MKRLLLAAVLLILLAGGYYFRGFFLETQDLNIHLYTLYSGNPDELYRFEPEGISASRALAFSAEAERYSSHTRTWGTRRKCTDFQFFRMSIRTCGSRFLRRLTSTA